MNPLKLNAANNGFEYEKGMNMERSEIAEKIRKNISSVVKHDDFEMSDELTANDVAGWDSLSHISIIIAIEKTFDIKFKLKDLNRMQNIGDVIELVSSKIEQQQTI